MLVAGSLASHLHTVRTMANHLNKTKSTLVLIDGVGDVLNEAVSFLLLFQSSHRWGKKMNRYRERNFSIFVPLLVIYNLLNRLNEHTQERTK